MSTAQTHTLIELARQHLASGQPQIASDCLDAVLALEPDNLTAHNLREVHALPGHYAGWMGVNAQISPDDDIFRFFAQHPSSRHALRDYLSDGWRTMTELQALLENYGHMLGRSRAFLEFACGHGRFTRHLVKRLPAGALTVSDVVPGSVDFLQQQLGVKGFYSSHDPAGVQFPERYEQVFVLSLFSHLPERTWGPWLARLHGALRPGGLLVFSTHGVQCAAAQGVTLDKGYAFFASSESSAIEGQVYGTTFTSADFVQATVRKVLGAGVSADVLPGHFWGQQDAVVIRG